MAQTFSTKKYLSKLTAHQLLSQLITNSGGQAFFEINEDTPRKLAVSLMEDSLKSLETETRLNVLRELSYVSSITNPHTARFAKKLFKEEKGIGFEPEIECTTDADLVLYFYLKHSDIADKLAFLSPFYISKSYISYEAKKVDKLEAETKMTELGREFSRLANKDDNATEQHMEKLHLESIWYVTSTFHEGYSVESKLTAEGETDRKHLARHTKTVRIAYLPNEEVVLISGNVSREQKITYLDTFLRIVTGGGYEQKNESYDLVPLKNMGLDFRAHNKGTPFMKASIRSVSFSYANGKKKLKLMLPPSSEHAGLQMLKESLDELGLADQFSTFTLTGASIGFMFQDLERENKSINVSCSISPSKASLCPLFEYERHTKSILKNAGIYEGFILKENK